MLAVHDRVDNDRIAFDLEKRPAVTHAKPILRREIGEPLDVALESMSQILELHGDLRGVLFRETAEILYCLRL